jgi:steroid delta-isomerase-like uncharacterized protein
MTAAADQNRHRDLRARRAATVREHMESENRHAFDVTIATFAHPRYEIVPTGDVYDGEEEVARYFEETRAAFPDQRNQLVAMHHADDAMIVEFDLMGTHLGNFRGLPATGRAFTCRTLAIFVFGDGDGDGDEGDRIVCERVYFDANTILRQLGMAHDPLTLKGRIATVLTHPLTIGTAIVKDLSGRAAVRRRHQDRHG